MKEKILTKQVRIPIEVHGSLKMESVLQGVTMCNLLAQLIKDNIKKHD